MALDFRDVFAHYWADYLKLFKKRIPVEHRKAARAILDCHTAALGGSLYHCEHCNTYHFGYHSCNHRNCPQCGYQTGLDWAEKQRAKLLPVPYSMVTFTIPGELREVFRSNQKLCYGLFFRCAADVLQEVAADPKYLGGSLGFLGVLHTWGRQLQYHPHIHFIIPHGGLSPRGAWVRPKSKDGTLFFPYDLLAVKIRMAMQKALRESEPELYAGIAEQVWWERWRCHATNPGNGEHAIDYLSRYVAQTALSSKRIVADDGERVTIAYTDSATGQSKTIKLTGIEFIRRYLQHVLPTRFKRVRYYGWLSPRAKKRYERILALLDWKPGDLNTEETEENGPLCPKCQKPLTLLEGWRRGRSPPQQAGQAKALYPNEG